MEHFAPHHSAAFEGWYSKFALPSGAHIAVVICAVPNATSLPPYMVSFTYYPSSGTPIYQREHWVENIDRITTGPGHAFKLIVKGTDCKGTMSVSTDSISTYSLKGTTLNSENIYQEAWSLTAITTSSHTPWHPNTPTPESWLVNLPLPLHWHVHSLCSHASFTLSIPPLDPHLPFSDKKGSTTIHQEKNWASSFPSAHIWVQARNHNSNTGICLAGGKILGMHAFILGYRSPQLNIDVRPPFALSVLGLSPTMSFEVDYANRLVWIDVRNWAYRVVVTAKAPKETGWFGLGAPFKEGHRRNFCSESFLAGVEVVVFEKAEWFGIKGWREVRREVFERASLEFAGEYFGGREKGE